MATTTITDLVRALNTTKTMVLAVDQEDSATGEIETVKIDLEQILNLFAVIGNEPPTGVAHIWTTDTIPTGYLELNGQAFDPNTYPQLGLIFPSGILPDWRGRVTKHAPAGQNAGTTEEDQIKQHNHIVNVAEAGIPEFTANTTDLGTQVTDANTGNHEHEWTIGGVGGANYPVMSNGYGGTYSTQGGGAHQHSINLGAHSHIIKVPNHGHSATCSTVGGSENTVKGVFTRYIVRAR